MPMPGYVSKTGDHYDGDVQVDILSYVIRPAFKLDLSKVLFTSVATGGKTGAPGADLSAAVAPTGAVKLTVLDSSITLTSVTPTAVNGHTIAFSYAGATANETLSAVVKNSSGDVSYYGKLAAINGTGAGTASVTVPDGLAATDTLQIFVEDINIDNFTDFASTPITLSVAEQTTPSGLAGVDCTTLANNDGQITGTTTAMEYSADGGTTWTSCTNSPTTGLASGSYQVRMTGYYDSGATKTYLASPETTVIVGAYILPHSNFEPSKYILRTLTDPAMGVSVTGLMASSAQLKVAQHILHSENTCPACDEIRAQQVAGNVLVLYDISVSGGYQGNLEVSIPVGTKYNGQSLKVLHCNNRELEQKTLTAQNGSVTGPWGGLSPFAVLKPLSNIKVPKTRNSVNMLPYIILSLVSLCGIIAVAKYRKKNILG